VGDFWEARALVAGDSSPEAEALRAEAEREISSAGTAGSAKR